MPLEPWCTNRSGLEDCPQSNQCRSASAERVIWSAGCRFLDSTFLELERSLNWTPRNGAAQLREDYPDIRDLLCEVLVGEITAIELATDARYIPLLHGLGGNHALNALKDQTGVRLGHWPRVWAARTLALLGDSACSSALLVAAEDPEWRVRMQVIRAAGLVTNPKTVEEIAHQLVSDTHPRVRQAVALAIGRKGNYQSAMLLGELSRDAEVSVRRAATRAGNRLQSQLS